MGETASPHIDSNPVIAPSTSSPAYLEKNLHKSSEEAQTLSGRVVRTQSGFFHVETEKGVFVCQISGRVKVEAQRAEAREEIQRSDLVALNDFVEIVVESEGRGMIVEVAEREHVLSRVAPGSGVGTSAESEQVILANTDQVVFVLAAKKPRPNPRVLDRLLVIAEKAEIESIVICINKIDLDKREQTRDTFQEYERIGYSVLYVSALTGENIEALRQVLTGEDEKVSVFTGPSGVGKSSLLNAIQEGLRLETKDVSDATTKGRHTTRFSQLLKLDEGGYVADTPGIRSIAPWDIEPHELDGYFIEMQPYIADCKFKDCSHVHEPGCKVREAVENGDISEDRYESYLRLREELEEQYVY